MKPSANNCLKGLTKTRMANWTTKNVKLRVNHLVEGIAQVAPLVHKDGRLNNQAVLVAVAEEVEEVEEAEHKGLV